ncbi:MAG: hypothetical protein FJ222_04645 [Lentisphaerae bacterium]|nr:hypothetical protein [Lentisphaerota bacterium]
MNTADLNNQQTEQHATPAGTRYRRQFVREAMEGFHKNFAPESRPVYVSGFGGRMTRLMRVHFNGTQLMKPVACIAGDNRPGVK